MFKFGRKKKESTRGLEPEPEVVAETVPEPELGLVPGPELEAIEQKEKMSKRAKLGGYLHDEWSKGVVKGKEELSKGVIKSKAAIQHAIGLGHQPNVIPAGEARVDCELRTVAIGWHPVPGMGVLEKSGIGKRITQSIGKYPDPTQHWAVLVGEFVHQLWMDEDLHVIYINERVKVEEWHTFEVGKTRFSDEALRQTGEMVIHNMRATRPAYNLINNNCQTYAVQMLDAIQIGAHREFATTFAIYQRATGAGTIKDLFIDKYPDEQNTDVVSDAISHDPARPQPHRVNTVQTAQQVMNEQTTKIDNHYTYS